MDTGDGNSVTLSAESWATARLIPPAKTSTISFGLGGAITTDLVILEELRTGDALTLPAVMPVRTFQVLVRGNDVLVRTEGEAPTPAEALIQRDAV